MKILTIGHSYIIDLNRRLCREIANAGGAAADVVAVAPTCFRGEWGKLRLEPSQHDEPYRLEPVSVYASLAKLPQIFVYGWKLRELLKQQWDIVHCSQEPYVLAGGQIAYWTQPNAKLVVATFQNLSKRYPLPFSQIESKVMRRADGWIPMSQTARDGTIDRPGRRDLPHQVIPPGVDTEVFWPNRAARIEIRRSLGWSDSDFVIGFLGRFVPEKGLHHLRAALELINPLSCKALIVGGGPLEPELRQWEASSQGQVRIQTGVGHAQAPAWINAMDVLVAPSQSTMRWVEQFGRMLIEAMACGVPVIGSNSGEIPHVVADAGLIVDESNDQEWAEALGRLLDNSKQRQEMTDRGLARVHERFAWPIVGKAHWEFFQSLL